MSIDDALREYDRKGGGLNVLPASSPAMTAIVEAARKYANPDITTVARLIREHWEDVEAGPTFTFTPEEIEMSEQLATSFVHAALGVTEDE